MLGDSRVRCDESSVLFGFAMIPTLGRMTGLSVSCVFFFFFFFSSWAMYGWRLARMVLGLGIVIFSLSLQD
jgi:hypothetical protein